MIKDILTSRMEDTTVADAIRAYFERHAGKRITERDVQKMMAQEAGAPDLRMRKAYGMTHLEWGGYSQTGGNQGHSLLIAYAEKNVVMDPAFLLEHNTSHYSGRDERNAARQAALTNSGLLDALEAAIARQHAAYDALMAVETEVKALMEQVGVDGYIIDGLMKGTTDRNGKKIYR